MTYYSQLLPTIPKNSSLDYPDKMRMIPIPCVDSHIYTIWQEKDADEELGWYLARFVSVKWQW